MLEIDEKQNPKYIGKKYLAVPKPTKHWKTVFENIFSKHNKVSLEAHTTSPKSFHFPMFSSFGASSRPIFTHTHTHRRGYKIGYEISNPIKKGALVRLGMGGGHSLGFDTWWDCLLPTIEKNRFSSKV